MMSRFFLSIALLFGFAIVQTAHGQLIGDMVDIAVSLSTPRVEQAGKTAQVTFVSEPIANTFNGVALQGFSSDPNIEGQIRFEETEGWSAWHSLYLVRSATDDAFLAAYRGTTFRAHQRFELRFTLDSSGDVKVSGAGVFDNRNDADHNKGAPTGLPTPQTGAKRPPVIVPPMLIPRTTWNALPFIGTPAPLNRPNYTNITFHHAAGFGATTLEEGLQQVRALRPIHHEFRRVPRIAQITAQVIVASRHAGRCGKFIRLAQLQRRKVKIPPHTRRVVVE